ncbi:hypothetical protein RZS08_65705, partial [Arthrospira platensis SPKY1]|nr:hypothetical protein [Arthrospira platensis SPKY1]
DVVAQQQGRPCPVNTRQGSRQGDLAFRVRRIGGGLRHAQDGTEVADGEGSAQGLPRSHEFASPGLANRLQAPPQLFHGLDHTQHERSGHPQREVQPGLGQTPQHHIVPVVDDV